jgi:peptidoglycan-associated lipoprotein
MRHVVAALLAVGLSACGGAKYPACEKDEDCKKNASGAPIDEYCVNQQCQECREDAQCGSGKGCQGGRCVATGCASDAECKSGQICENKACVQALCSADGDCSSGEKCDGGRCIASGGCVSDQECGSGMVCQNGECKEAGTKVSAQCRPTSGGGDVVALENVNFDFDQDDLTVNARNTLQQNAECIKQAPDVQIVLEGHCDERGTQEYNLGLGERRANAVKSYLKNLGIDTSRMKTLSKGENEPTCNEASDSCYSQNRRVEFIQKRGSRM